MVAFLAKKLFQLEQQQQVWLPCVRVYVCALLLPKIYSLISTYGLFDGTHTLVYLALSQDSRQKPSETPTNYPIINVFLRICLRFKMVLSAAATQLTTAALRALDSHHHHHRRVVHFAGL